MSTIGSSICSWALRSLEMQIIELIGGIEERDPADEVFPVFILAEKFLDKIFIQPCALISVLDTVGGFHAAELV